MEPHQEPEWIFRLEWTYCARRGWCDCLDSREYDRVLVAWLAWGQPMQIREFIKRHANATPERRGDNVRP